MIIYICAYSPVFSGCHCGIQDGFSWKAILGCYIFIYIVAPRIPVAFDRYQEKTLQPLGGRTLSVALSRAIFAEAIRLLNNAKNLTLP